MNERKEERGFIDANTLFEEDSRNVDEFYAARMGITDSAEQSTVRSSSRRHRPVPDSSPLLSDVEPMSANIILPSESGTRNAKSQTPKP